MTVPTIDVLPAIAASVGERIDVLLDSGTRRGTDIIAALTGMAKLSELDGSYVRRPGDSCLN